MALFAAACGGDSDGDDTAPLTSVTTDEGSGEDGGDDGGDSETTEAPAGTSAPKDADFGGADPSSEWCQLAADVQNQLDAVEADPFAFFSEEGITTITAALDQAVQVAPAEIRSDVATSRDSFAEIAAVLERYDYDLLSIPEEELTAIDPTASEVAADRIEAYNEQVCGIESDSGGVDAAPPADDTSDPAPSLGDSDAAVDLFVQGLTDSLPITEEQARCLAEELDLGSLAAGGNLDPNDPELLDQLFAVLGDCDISISDLTG
ncbi:MAG: hypothetical protein AAFZ07_01855 [Actinomycetota bacterium]